MGLRNWIKAIRGYTTKCGEVNELRDRLTQVELQLQTTAQQNRQLEDAWLAQKYDTEQVEKKLAACVSALCAFCPKLDSAERMTQFYDAIMPALDRDGFRLYFTAQEMTGFQPYNAFPYEDARGVFEEADGHELMAYLLADRFDAVDWEIVPGTCYESASLKEIDTATPEYQAFTRELYDKTLRKLGFGDILSSKQTPEQNKEKKGCDRLAR